MQVRRDQVPSSETPNNLLDPTLPKLQFQEVHSSQDKQMSKLPLYRYFLKATYIYKLV